MRMIATDASDLFLAMDRRSESKIVEKTALNFRLKPVIDQAADCRFPSYCNTSYYAYFVVFA